MSSYSQGVWIQSVNLRYDRRHSSVFNSVFSVCGTLDPFEQIIVHFLKPSIWQSTVLVFQSSNIITHQKEVNCTGVINLEIAQFIIII